MHVDCNKNVRISDNRQDLFVCDKRKKEILEVEESMPGQIIDCQHGENEEV